MAEITKSMAQKWLGDAPTDKPFWLQDGRSLKNLAELDAALRGMSEETFRYHLNETKNDFSNWVRDVIGEDTNGLIIEWTYPHSTAWPFNYETISNP